MNSNFTTLLRVILALVLLVRVVDDEDVKAEREKFINSEPLEGFTLVSIRSKRSKRDGLGKRPPAWPFSLKPETVSLESPSG